MPGPVLGAIGQFISGKILFSLMNVALAYKMIQKHFVCGELMQRQTIPCIFSQHLKILFLLCFGGALGLMALEGWSFARTGWMPVHMSTEWHFLMWSGYILMVSKETQIS